MRDAARKFGFNTELNNSHEMGLLKRTYLSIKIVLNEINWEVFINKEQSLLITCKSLVMQ